MESRTLNGYDPSALDLSIRWSTLDNRLKATGEKIEKIKAGKIRVDLSGEAASDGPQNAAASEAAEGSRPGPEKAFTPGSAALPVDRAAVRESQAQRADTLPEAEQALPAAEAGPEPSVLTETPAAVSAEASEVSEAEAAPADDGASEDNGPVIVSEAEEDDTGDDMIAVMRGVLFRDAIDRVDREAYEAAMKADLKELEWLWNDFVIRDAGEGFRLLKELGLVTNEAALPPPEDGEDCGKIFEPSEACCSLQR